MGAHSAEFDQHVGRRLRTARGLAAHDAGEQFHAALVGDDADGRIERVALAVEREQALALARAPHREVAVHFGGVEHVQRTAAVVGDEIGDIDQRVDGTQADRNEPALQPCRRGAVVHPAHEPQRESGAERRRRPEVERHLHWAREPPSRPAGCLSSRSLPMSAAARSRAMPLTPAQSARLGVRLISITGSSSPAHCA